jgi:hypothetical protein
MKRKIVFINQATGYLTIDIVNRFVSSFDEVALIAGSIRIQDTELNGKVRVSKIIRYNREGVVKKALSWFIGSVQILWLLLFHYRDCEIFFTTLPPTAYLMTFFLRKRKFSVLFYDIYPEALKILNITESSIIFRIWSALNSRILKRAYRIFTLSEGMKDRLQKYSGQKDIFVIPNWSGLAFKPEDIPLPNPFRIEHNLDKYFLVEYSGNIGYSHRVEIIVELARKLVKEKNIFFIIIGRGERLEYINNLINTYGLINCQTLFFQSDPNIKYSLSAADLSIVTLDDRAPSMSVPSKVYNLLKVGSPIMGIGSSDSELARLLADNHIGKNFLPTEIDRMAEFILQLKNDPVMLGELRAISLLASREYTPENSKKYLQFYLNMV